MLDRHKYSSELFFFPASSQLKKPALPVADKPRVLAGLVLSRSTVLREASNYSHMPNSPPTIYLPPKKEGSSTTVMLFHTGQDRKPGHKALSVDFSFG